MQINFNKKKLVLILTIFLELAIGFIFLLNFYQKTIVSKSLNSEKITTIKRENLIFPKESEFRYYYELQSNIEATDSPKWLGYEAKYTYNSDGLNERFDYAVEKPSNTFRIITLGDSFTYGHYVDTKDNWPEQLEEMLNQNLANETIENFEVINLGMAGWDVPYIVKRYKDIGEKYNPDLIIWFESGSGFTRLNELLKPIIENYAEKCQKELVNELENQERNYRCQIEGWKQAEEEIKTAYSYEEIERIISNYFNDFVFSLKQKRVLFFTFDESFLKDEWKNTLKKWEENYFSKITFLSIVPNIYSLNQHLADGHPDAQGYQTIAISIYKYLENNIINQSE